uniref:Uncharacterized protein n=1 Tax=Peronospora matthiolae TaxID=2874970 RepID=A0AAV1URX2_9STRA
MLETSDRAIVRTNPRLTQVLPKIGRVEMVVMHRYITASEVTREIEVTGVSAHAGTNQEARHQNVLRNAPQVESPWMPPSRVLDRLAGTTTEWDRIPLFDRKKIFPPDFSTETIRADEEFFTDAFLKHRWYNGSSDRNV